jgi:serine/threonine protein kinase/Flp pilus assembly protein TadD
MHAATMPPSLAAVDDFVEAFETAQARGDQADLAAFLPASDQPLYASALTELIRIELEYSWRRGQSRRMVDYLRRFPQLKEDRDALHQIAFEEYRLRCQAGENPSPAEYQQQFGLAVASWPRPGEAFDRGAAASVEDAARTYWTMRQVSVDGLARDLTSWCDGISDSGEPARLFRDLHHSDPAAAGRLAQAVISMPEAGSDFLGFHLLQELGRGAFARVFLARQGDLANRLVALKICTDAFGEAQTLAQLQHTNIVPIYSIHRTEPFQAVCMPYFGSTTLAHVLQSVARQGSLPASGKHLVSTLHLRKNSTRVPGRVGVGSVEPSMPAPNAPAAIGPQADMAHQKRTPADLQTLAGLTYVQAVLWIGARLAAGLAHAHERHVIHRDLKPANVLLTDDGQPMLLDFNLSDNQQLGAGATAASVGGTLAYMAPEHLEAFQDASRPVDARSDLFSLGILLQELLTGLPAFPVRRGPTKDILPLLIADRLSGPPRIKALSKEVTPAVASIIRHCLQPDPAKRYQSARELEEDLTRQLAHLPLRHAPEPSLRERASKWVRRHPRLTSMGSVATVALVLVAILGGLVVARSQRLAQLQAQECLNGFREDMQTAQYLLYGRTANRDQLADGMNRCRDTLDRYQVLDNPAWEEGAKVRPLAATDRERLREDVGELLFLLARATSLDAVYQPDLGRQQEQVGQALRWNEAATLCYAGDHVPRAVVEQRGELRQRLGDQDEAQHLFLQAADMPLRTAADCYLAAHLHAQRGHYRKALPLLEQATRKDPLSFAAWFVKGNCHDGLLQNAEAAACYGTCIALRPRVHWSWYNRGLAYLRNYEHAKAAADFDKAIELQPDWAEVYWNRAQAYEGMGKYPEALADLSRALDLGSPPALVYYTRANVREKTKDLEAAKRDREEVRRQQPDDEASWVARGLARLPADAAGALADFDAALRLNPRSFPALQNKAHLLADCLNRDADAVAVLGQAVALYPDLVLPRAGRGVSLARLGRRETALADAREALLLDTTPPNLYQVGCIYALTSRQNPEDRLRAFELLSRALRGGFGLDVVDFDTDVDPIRHDKEFRRLVEAARALQSPPTPASAHHK